MKNNVVLIGGNGLVGKATKRLLTKKGFNVFILDKRVKSNTEDIFVDITKKNTLIKLKEFIPKNSFIVNLAAKQYGDKPPKNNRELWFDTTNYHGAINCLEFAKSNDCKGFIQFSSDMVYGIPSTVPVKENHQLNPIGEYGQSKKKIEAYIYNYRKISSFSITILRPRLILGPTRLGVFKNLFQLIKWNLPVPLIGNGKNTYQMVSHEDCANAIFLTIIKNCPNEVFNLGSNVNLDVYNLLNKTINNNKSYSILIKSPSLLIKLLLKTLSFFIL